jgi:hypothetical protein
MAPAACPRAQGVLCKDDDDSILSRPVRRHGALELLALEPRLATAALLVSHEHGRRSGVLVLALLTLTNSDAHGTATGLSCWTSARRDCEWTCRPPRHSPARKGNSSHRAHERITVRTAALSRRAAPLRALRVAARLNNTRQSCNHLITCIRQILFSSHQRPNAPVWAHRARRSQRFRSDCVSCHAPYGRCRLTSSTCLHERAISLHPSLRGSIGRINR